MAITELTGRERPRARRRRWAEESRPEDWVRPIEPVQRLEHDLGDCLEHWSTLGSRVELERDPAYQRHRAEVEALIRGHKWDLRDANATRTVHEGRLRAVAWNVERGKRWSAICGIFDEHPQMQDLDIALLTEVDLGVGRSDNRDVAGQLAKRLGMGHVFSPSHVLLSAGDPAELDHGVANTLAMHGVALLTRFPVRRVRGVPLPEFGDKLGAVERRLGAKRAVLVELDTPGQPLTVGVVHLDPFAPPAHRARQMRLVLGALDGAPGQGVLVGGDFNTNTYDLGGPLGLAANITHKLVRFGFAGTVAQYMTPYAVFERHLFDALAEAGLSTEGFVDPSAGTLRFDLNDPELEDKVGRVLPKPALRYLQQRLEPWRGTVPMRLDWFAGRDVQPRSAWTVDRPRHQGMHVSDHDPIGVELRWPPSTLRPD